MALRISILCTGDEILDGRIEDSNSRFLIGKISEFGVKVQQILASRDSIEGIEQSIRYLLLSSDLLIISGGLGPTSDDLTREAVAKFVGKPLYQDDDTLSDLKELYRQRKRVFDSSNIKQATFPEASRILKNPVGTAAGFHCVWSDSGKLERNIFVVPGVPHELKRMYADHIAPFVAQRSGLAAAPKVRYFHVFGRPEAKVGELVERDGVPPGISISYRAHYPEIIVKISSDGAAIDSFADKSSLALGNDFIFSNLPEQTLDETVHALLIEKKKTISVAESCTGGMLGSLLTKNAGSSAYFLGGIISYSNDVKTDLLEVDPALIKVHGAVSAPVAQAMAKSIRERLKSDLAISITGIAGPDGGTPEKPIGTFFLGFSHAGGTETFHCFASASRNMIRTFASFTALDVARRHLLGYPLRPAEIIGNVQTS
jgi:nicotinamide-nucleotide amidase